jgi:hypothetical protein
MIRWFAYFCAMEKPVYPITASDQGLKYSFDITNNERVIVKVITFTPVEASFDLYEMVFGTLMPNGKVDVLTVDGDHHLEKIISTVISSLLQFLELNPNTSVFFSGSTPARNRLYRAVITKVTSATELPYQIWGFTTEDNLEVFDKSHHYTGYIIHGKNEIL